MYQPVLGHHPRKSSEYNVGSPCWLYVTIMYIIMVLVLVGTVPVLYPHCWVQKFLSCTESIQMQQRCLTEFSMFVIDCSLY